MKKFFPLLLVPLFVVACHSRQEKTAQAESPSATNDTLVTVYEGWAESSDGQAVLYDLLVLTPLNGGDELYEMVMTYTDPQSGRDTSISTPAQVAQVPDDVVEEFDEVIFFTGKNGEELSLWERGDSMLVAVGRDIKKIGDKTIRVLKRL